MIKTTMMKLLSSVIRGAVGVLVAAALACSRPRRVELANPADSVTSVLVIANGYGGKLVITSHPKVTTPRRDIVRVDSFYVDSSHPGTRAVPPQYRRLVHWPASVGTDTVAGEPLLVNNGRVGGGEVHRSRLFNANVHEELLGDDITTIGVLTASEAVTKYGEQGRHGAILLTTVSEPQPDESAQLISGDRVFHAALRGDTGSMPNRVSLQFVVDTTGRVDSNSFVVFPLEAFVEPARKEAILGTVWKPARRHGRPVREKQMFGINTSGDSIQSH